MRHQWPGRQQLVQWVIDVMTFDEAVETDSCASRCPRKTENCLRSKYLATTTEWSSVLPEGDCVSAVMDVLCGHSNNSAAPSVVALRGLSSNLLVACSC